MSAVPPRAAHALSAASPWIARHAHLVPRGARVLDLASGAGRHARFFAERGCRVVAIDRDADALATLACVAGVETRTADLETGEWPLSGEVYDAIVVANYLHRPRLRDVVGALAADGTLLYETFARGNEAYGRPTNPAFLLERDELLRIAAPLVVVAFEQGFVAGERQAVVQRIAAVGAQREWPPMLGA